MKNAVFLSFLLLFLSCRTMNPEKYTKSKLIFGSGGGFTNLREEYHLLENGRLFHKTNFDTSFKEVKLPKTVKIEPLFAEAHQIFDTLQEYGEPANRYFFLKFKNKDNFQEVVWGNGKAPEKSKQLYKKLMKLTEKNTPDTDE